ncbi:unnamed protein product [Umbelopsis ramanniana]
MESNIKVPSEILSIALQHLCPQDLVSCSRTCWTWNAIANTLLYEAVSLSSIANFRQFVECISEYKDHHGGCAEKTSGSYQPPLGQLVKAVEVTGGYTKFDDRRNYSSTLSRLAFHTPNVHTAKVFVPILSLDTADGSPFSWSTLAAQWPKLTNLTLKGSMNTGADTYDLHNINHVFYRLQHLNITRCEAILAHMRTPLPFLQFLGATIHSPSDYQALKEFLRTCQTTLHTLIIELWCFHRQALFNLDDLDIGHKQLKAFGLKKHDMSQITMTNFGENLEHLECWNISPGPHAALCQSIYQGMMKTSNLKTLSFYKNMATYEISRVLVANKNTLHTLYLNLDRGIDLIPLLQENNVQLYNVFTLCFECKLLENAHVHSLAKVFPNVKFLALCRNLRPLQHVKTNRTSTMPDGSIVAIWKQQKGEPWISTEALSHFQHLKALDRITFSELEDQSLSTLQQCDIFRPIHKGQPSVIPLS